MIPKRIFTIWLNDEPELPPLIKKCVATHKLEGYEHVLVTLKDVKGFYTITEDYVEECLEAKKWAKAADYLRMRYLNEQGGIYLDADMEMLPGKDFEGLLDTQMFVSSDMGNMYWSNAVVGSTPNNPLLTEYLRRVRDNFKGGGDSVFEPGIRTFTDVLWENGVGRGKEGVSVIPPELFFPYNHITGETKVTDLTRGIHHYSKSWVKK